MADGSVVTSAGVVGACRFGGGWLYAGIPFRRSADRQAAIPATAATVDRGSPLDASSYSTPWTRNRCTDRVLCMGWPTSCTARGRDLFARGDAAGVGSPYRRRLRTYPMPKIFSFFGSLMVPLVTDMNREKNAALRMSGRLRCRLWESE
jgi:hypothetical protein